MKIKAIDEFGLELDDEELTKSYAEKVPDCLTGTMIIDLSHCIIDYRATSLIMDAALSKLCRVHGPRKLTIAFNIKFQERLFLKWLFFGSKLLELDQGTASNEEIRAKVDGGLRRLGVVVDIVISGPENQLGAPIYSYGQ